MGILDSLNTEQRRAVVTTEGPLLVLAGAGTGKTRVITTRIGHLLSKRVSPKSILAMTFTKKAAEEMRARVAKVVGKKKAKELTVGTFHGFCARLLRAHGQSIGVPKNYTICDASDQLATARSALREIHVPEASLRPATLLARMSLAKNRMLGPDAVEGSGDELDELVGRAWQRYDDRLARARTLDFDDLLLCSLKLLREDKGVREALQERFRYLLVDEFQDTNGPQYEIVRRLAGARKNLCVVGDDDQSIYGWRGADVSKILGFERDFPGAVTVRLETNYRSTQEILETANKLIANNTGRHEKALRSAFGSGERVKAYVLEDDVTEADFVALEIADLVRHEKAQYRDFAILFRTQTQPRAFETQLRARGIPYVLIGGMSFFDRKEVRDVLAYLKLLVNPLDEPSFLRVLNTPPRGVGKTSLDKAMAFATQQGISVVEAFERAAEIPDLRPAAGEAVAAMRASLASLGQDDPGATLVKRIEDLIDVIGYRGEVERLYSSPAEQEGRWNAVTEILNTAATHVVREEKPTLAGFLEELCLNANDDRDKDEGNRRDAVTLMTLHSAKGLEFPRVYLVGMEEGLLPHHRSALEDSIEEERRLAYVGITRAQRVLVVTQCGRRAKYGTVIPSHTSRFLYEIRGETPPKEWRPTGSKDEVVPAKKKRATKKRGKARARKGASRPRSG